MKKPFSYLYLLASLAFIVYLILPIPGFPEALHNSIRSDEPADVETTLRRGYYTQFTRAEVTAHYERSFNAHKIINFAFVYPSIRLNYPPEEAQTIIRDQTRSTYLEEIVHPLRESVFVNGFEPTKDKDVIIKEGVKYRQKVIVRYYQSNVFARVVVGFGVIVLTPIVFFTYKSYFSRYKYLLYLRK